MRATYRNRAVDVVDAPRLNPGGVRSTPLKPVVRMRAILANKKPDLSAQEQRQRRHFEVSSLVLIGLQDRFDHWAESFLEVGAAGYVL
jgi:hypothetical protein